MTEIFLAYRDGVGLHSTVLLEGKQTLIKDLPAGLYNMYNKEALIREKIDPNTIPGFLLHYCTDLEKSGFQFKGNTVFEMISNLEMIVKPN
jgi:hypothetical protein